MALAFRNTLRAARSFMVRGYAEAAPAIKEGEMALTLAAGNKVTDL